jgi:hypothetical protein
MLLEITPKNLFEEIGRCGDEVTVYCELHFVLPHQDPCCHVSEPSKCQRKLQIIAEYHVHLLQGAAAFHSHQTDCAATVCGADAALLAKIGDDGWRDCSMRSGFSSGLQVGFVVIVPLV